MTTADQPVWVELSADEMHAESGGNPAAIATLLYGCFVSGLAFGYNVVGPAIEAALACD